MIRFNYYLPEKQFSLLQNRAEQIGVSVAEVLRKVADYGLQGPVMDQLYPCLSGSFQIGVRK